LPDIAQLQLAILGVSADVRGLRITASIAVASIDGSVLRLTAPLGGQGVSAGIANADGMMVMADGLEARVEGQTWSSGDVVISAQHPFIFELVMADSTLSQGYDWQQVVRALAAPDGRTTLTVTVTDPGIGEFREALRGSSVLNTDNTLSGSWPPAG
jgi:hypothetical protein